MLHCLKSHVPAQVFSLFQGLDEWTTSNVVDWMAALNLYRYAELFRDRGVSGRDLLKMDEDKLNVSIFLLI